MQSNDKKLQCRRFMYQNLYFRRNQFRNNFCIHNHGYFTIYLISFCKMIVEDFLDDIIDIDASDVILRLNRGI